MTWNQSKTGTGIDDELIDLDSEANLPILDVAHGQRPVVCVKQIMPNDAAFRVGLQVITSDHDLALLKVLSNCEGE